MIKKAVFSRVAVIVFLVTSGLLCYSFYPAFTDKDLVTYTTQPSKITMFFQNDKGKRIGSLKDLRKHVEGKGQKLEFAMNGGMYGPDRSPVGLYIENGREISTIDTSENDGNFYMKPNGIFYITSDNKAFVTATENFKDSGNVKYATQSGPMLLIDGQLHPRFKEASKNTNIRNGVGILPDGRVLLAMSKEKINFYDFAMYFKEQGCKNALYLDGLVSKTYAPGQNWVEEGGNFGVIIAITKK